MINDVHTINDFHGEYFWLSNFYPVEILLDEPWPYASVEHAYMSQKSRDPAWKRFCRDTKNAADVKTASYNIQLRGDWEHIKEDVMRTCLVQKFGVPESKLQDLLLGTGNKTLVEGNTWKDTFWGVDTKTGIGKNKLGTMLMEIRSQLLHKNVILSKDL